MSRKTQTKNRLIALGILLLIGLPFFGCNTFKKSATRFASLDSKDSEQQFPIAAQIAVAKAAEKHRDHYAARHRMEQRQKSEPNSFADFPSSEIKLPGDRQTVLRASHEAEQNSLHPAGTRRPIH